MLRFQSGDRVYVSTGQGPPRCGLIVDEDQFDSSYKVCLDDRDGALEWFPDVNLSPYHFRRGALVRSLGIPGAMAGEIGVVLGGNPELYNVQFDWMISACSPSCISPIEYLSVGAHVQDSARNKGQIIGYDSDTNLFMVDFTKKRSILYARHSDLCRDEAKKLEWVALYFAFCSRLDYPDALKIGTRVVPGPTWKWHQENGVGEVVAGEEQDGWLRVRWSSGFTSRFRYAPEKHLADIVPYPGF